MDPTSSRWRPRPPRSPPSSAASTASSTSTTTIWPASRSCRSWSTARRPPATASTSRTSRTRWRPSRAVGAALLIMLNLPFALIGGTFALFLWRTNFNISAAVGYVAVFGVSVLNGVVLVATIRQAQSDGWPLREAIERGCAIRFRAIVVSAIVAVIGFLPAALSHGIGSEIQRPLARVVIGGLISSTALTLLVLPAVYERRRRRRTADE